MVFNRARFWDHFFFIIYTVDIGSFIASHGLLLADIDSIIAAHGLLHHSYADDTQIYFYCRPSEWAALTDKVISCTDAVADWMTINELRLNTSKSEFLSCVTLQRRHHINKERFTFFDGEVQPICSTGNLGAFFRFRYECEDAHQSPRNQLLLPVAKDTVNKRITTDNDVALTLINSFVISRVDYCNSLLVGLSAYQTNRIQAVLNDEARLIFGGSRRDHVTPIMRDRLHWLCAPQRIEFKVVLSAYKALNNLTPDYIAGYCQSSSINQRRSTLRSADEGVLIAPKTVTEFGKRSFAFVGPHLCATIAISRHP